MATEAGFSEASFTSSALASLRQRLPGNTRGSNKRKRGNQDDMPTDSRVSTLSRRSASNSYAQQLHDAAAPTASMGDSHNDNFFNQQPQDNGSDDPSAQQFDLSALQAQNQNTGGHGSNVGTNANVDTAAAALSQHYSMQVPPHPADTFITQPTVGAEQTYGNMDDAHEYAGPEGDMSSASLGVGTPGKPAVGTDEWHKQRKDNHKEVERRRRETINEGINELAKIVPGCEKNKGSILARAVQYIAKLHEDASQNIDKWTFEKLVTEQAINDLSSKLQRAYAEREAWKRVAKQAGVDIDNVDLGLELHPDDDDDGKQGQGQKGGQVHGDGVNDDGGPGSDGL